MSEFVTKNSQALSIGGTAATISFPPVNDLSLRRTGQQSIRKGRFAKVENTHASQTLYVRFVGAATTTAFDVAIGAGKTVIFPIPGSDTVSMIASGATTTGFAHVGDFTN